MDRIDKDQSLARKSASGLESEKDGVEWGESPQKVLRGKKWVTQCEAAEKFDTNHAYINKIVHTKTYLHLMWKERVSCEMKRVKFWSGQIQRKPGWRALTHSAEMIIFHVKKRWLPTITRIGFTSGEAEKSSDLYSARWSKLDTGKSRKRTM